MSTVLPYTPGLVVSKTRPGNDDRCGSAVIAWAGLVLSLMGMGVNTLYAVILWRQPRPVSRLTVGYFAALAVVCASLALYWMGQL